MALRALSKFLTIFALVREISSQAIVDTRWLNPAGSKGDFAMVWNSGDTITISWKALNNSRSDLWLTHSSLSQFTWHQSIARNIDISIDSGYQWAIDVPTWTIKNDNHFVLRFYPAGVDYTALMMAQFASPGFIVQGGTTSTDVAGAQTTTTDNPSQQSAYSNSAISTPATTSIAASSFFGSNSQTTLADQSGSNSRSGAISSSSMVLTTTNAAGNTVTATVTANISSPTDINASSQSSSSSSSSPINLSLGAQAGIGLGAGLFIILLFITGCFFGRRIGFGRPPPKGLELLNAHPLDPDGRAMQQTAILGFNRNVPGVAPMGHYGNRPHTSTTTISELADDSILVRKGENVGKWQKSRTPLVEMMGSSSFPVEKAGSMVRPGMYEVQ